MSRPASVERIYFHLHSHHKQPHCKGNNKQQVVPHSNRDLHSCQLLVNLAIQSSYHWTSKTRETVIIISFGAAVHRLTCPWKGALRACTHGFTAGFTAFHNPGSLAPAGTPWPTRTSACLTSFTTQRMNQAGKAIYKSRYPTKKRAKSSSRPAFFPSANSCPSVPIR